MDKAGKFHLCSICCWSTVVEDSGGKYILFCIKQESPCYAKQVLPTGNCREWENEELGDEDNEQL